MVNSYKDLTVWQRSIELVKAVYILTGKLPREEQYGLTSQMRRAAVSVPSNIAEGRHRGTRKDFRYFLVVAYGSCAELETQLIIAQELGFVSVDVLHTPNELLIEVMKMLNVMISKLSSEQEAES